MKQRRSVWQWLADKAGVQARLTRDEWLCAYRMGAATVIPKPAYQSTGEYREMLTEQASGAYARLLAPRPTELVQPITQPEPPAKQTVTSSLPAVGPDGYYLNPGEKARRWRQQTSR